jgi:hypothetical protein
MFADTAVDLATGNLARTVVPVPLLSISSNRTGAFSSSFATMIDPTVYGIAVGIHQSRMSLRK